MVIVAILITRIHDRSPFFFCTIRFALHTFAHKGFEPYADLSGLTHTFWLVANADSVSIRNPRKTAIFQVVANSAKNATIAKIMQP